MQSIINASKIFILAVLTTSLILTWNDGKNDVSSLVPTGPSVHANTNVRPIEPIEPIESVDSVWSIMGREFKLDNRAQSSQVQAEIRKLLADQGKLYNILKAAGPYIYFIHKQTEARGLPAEIALIPVIESEFNPNDHSNKGALGLWQLMSGTAHELGIKIKSGYDGRRNVVASTKAALAYFNDLGNYFKGDWYLAIAAYNCGQMKVKSAIRRTGRESFWNLPLPKETKYYVPKLLAVAEIIKNPEKYGVQLPPIINEPYFAELEVSKPVTLEQVAKKSGVSIQTLHTLNPDYTHASKPKKETVTLLVPVDKAPIVKANFGLVKV
jgi:membrane-bound lytic murein transglycosylase D